MQIRGKISIFTLFILHKVFAIGVPENLEGPLSVYPNVLNITVEEQSRFHPVVKFPKTPTVLNLRHINGSLELSRKRRNLFQRVLNVLEQNYTIGKYDEDRTQLYSSEMFRNETHAVDGFDGARTVHVGIDLGGPVGTKVFSFMDGIVSSVGYNKDLGDYGCVTVMKYDLDDLYDHHHHNNTSSVPGSDQRRVFYALYGHLDWSVMRKKKGQKVKKGDVLGRMGDVHLNGGTFYAVFSSDGSINIHALSSNHPLFLLGWKTPHVHFQLSVHEPMTHDLPGAVARNDRAKALLEYPDPRWILGELY
jgi:murein DD-endopeptidase MepM/ murein hydrolase activator NlpD